MDRPNAPSGPPSHGEQDPKTMSRAEYTRSVRASMEERRRRAMANRQQYQPQIHEQIQRLFSEYNAPFYARIRGFGRAQTLALAESTVLGLAAGTNRRLSDTETQALTEHFLSSVHNMLAWKWVMTGLAGYMAYRGRKTMRFPFFRPVITGGRLDPATGGPQVRIMWHTARFAAYYCAFWLIGEPVFQGINFMRQSYSMDNDPRLAGLLRDGKKQASEVLGAVQDSNSDAWQSEDSPPSDSSHSYENYEQQQQQRYQDSQQKQTASWSSQSTSAQPPSENGWGVADDFDDASPVAAAAQSQNTSSPSYNGSAWDRVRQQAQYSPGRNRPRDQKTWETPQGMGSGSGSWAGNDETSSQGQNQRDGYSYSSADKETATAKNQAQKKFDEMLERERRGTEQERGSWSRR